MGPSLYMARPIRVDTECLGCHSTPSLAPATMILWLIANAILYVQFIRPMRRIARVAGTLSLPARRPAMRRPKVRRRSLSRRRFSAWNSI